MYYIYVLYAIYVLYSAGIYIVEVIKRQTIVCRWGRRIACEDFQNKVRDLFDIIHFIWVNWKS